MYMRHLFLYMCRYCMIDNIKVYNVLVLSVKFINQSSWSCQHDTCATLSFVNFISFLHMSDKNVLTTCITLYKECKFHLTVYNCFCVLQKGDKYDTIHVHVILCTKFYQEPQKPHVLAASIKNHSTKRWQWVHVYMHIISLTPTLPYLI